MKDRHLFKPLLTGGRSMFNVRCSRYVQFHMTWQVTASPLITEVYPPQAGLTALGGRLA